jgi:hypothetical protein
LGRIIPEKKAEGKDWNHGLRMKNQESRITNQEGNHGWARMNTDYKPQMTQITQNGLKQIFNHRFLRLHRMKPRMGTDEHGLKTTDDTDLDHGEPQRIKKQESGSKKETADLHG